MGDRLLLEVPRSITESTSRQDVLEQAKNRKEAQEAAAPFTDAFSPFFVNNPV